jgi:integrase
MPVYRVDFVRLRNMPIPLVRIEVQLLREQLLVRPPVTRAVFATEKGGVYSHSGFQSIWLPALLAAGLAHEEKREGRKIVAADFRFHWLRHTAISLMARAGMKAELIAQRVGHNDGGALIYSTAATATSSPPRSAKPSRCSTA